jgi:hypothetical protein
MRIYQIVVAFLMTMASVAPAAAQQSLQLDAIRAQQEEIRVGVGNKTGPYKDLPESKRDELLTKQAFVLRTIEGKRTSDDLSQNERMDVFNALEWIEAAINDADDERMVCKLEKSTGSNRHVRVCKTVAQMREERENARRTMMQGQRCGDLSCISN